MATTAMVAETRGARISSSMFDGAVKTEGTNFARHGLLRRVLYSSKYVVSASYACASSSTTIAGTYNDYKQLAGYISIPRNPSVCRGVIETTSLLLHSTLREASLYPAKTSTRELPVNGETRVESGYLGEETSVDNQRAIIVLYAI